MGSFGRSRPSRPVGTSVIALITSYPSITLPNTGCLLASGGPNQSRRRFRSTLMAALPEYARLEDDALLDQWGARLCPAAHGHASRVEDPNLKQEPH